MNVAILDYGVGNLFKVAHAFETLGAVVDITNDSSNISKYSHLVLPGVGHFGSGVNAFNNSSLREGLDNHVKQGKPLLGICLGMQMLFQSSEESTSVSGLNYIAGKCVRFTQETIQGHQFKVPHIGWSTLRSNPEGLPWKQGLFKEITEEEKVYFVHSYYAVPENKSHIMGQTTYGNTTYCTAVKKDNIYGCQFHPENSGAVGLKILNSFLGENNV